MEIEEYDVVVIGGGPAGENAAQYAVEGASVNGKDLTSAIVERELLGAGYVIWLGVQAIRHRSDARRAMADATPVRRGHPVRIGFTVGATNPKTIVFFVAFLPQFTDPTGPIALQTMVLGLVFGLLAAASDSIWALAAGAARTWFASRPSRLDTLSATGGTMMIGLGATMLTVD